MAKKKPVEETPVETTGTSEKTIVQISVVKGGKTFLHTFEIDSDDEIESKLNKVRRRVKFWGGFLVRVLVNGSKANEKMVEAIEKVLSKI